MSWQKKLLDAIRSVDCQCTGQSVESNGEFVQQIWSAAYCVCCGKTGITWCISSNAPRNDDNRRPAVCESCRKKIDRMFPQCRDKSIPDLTE